MNPRHKSEDTAPLLLTIAEAQAALKCGRGKILTMARDGQLEMVTLGRRSLRITNSSVQSLLGELIRKAKRDARAKLSHPGQP